MSVKMKTMQVPVDVVQDIRAIFTDLGYVSPLVSRVAIQSLIRGFVVDMDHEDTQKALAETPGCLDRFRTFFTVDKYSIPWFHINLEWWYAADYQNRAFRFQMDVTKFLNEHFTREPLRKDKSKVERPFVTDGSEFVVAENMFTYCDYKRDEIEPFHPRDEYPLSLREAAPNGQKFFGRQMLEPVSEWLESLIDPDDSEKNGDSNTPEESMKGDQPGQGQGQPGQGSGGDSEGDGESSEGENDGEGAAKFLNEILDSASDDEVKEHMAQNPEAKSKQWGNQSSSLFKRYTNLKPVPKRKWETLVHVFTARSPEYIQTQTWNMQNTALANFLNPYGGRLPANQMAEKPVLNKVHAALYTDTSGSCVHLFDRFAAAALSLPEDKFESELFAFDTRVYPIDKNNVVMRGGGGTDAAPIVTSVNDYEKRNGVYPSVICLTDGYFSMPNIPFEKRSKWIWLLTEDGTEEYIPKGCNIVQLKDYE